MACVAAEHFCSGFLGLILGLVSGLVVGPAQSLHGDRRKIHGIISLMRPDLSSPGVQGDGFPWREAHYAVADAAVMGQGAALPVQFTPLAQPR